MKFKPNNINPQGRPKVYFCCHPNDFDNYFESVSNDILEKQKCTIWYAENEDERDDEYLSNIKEMQLFVMPVTTNLLCTENEALDVEFKFAIENHIPVLPLMQEADLEELFNQKCGDLQFLDKQNTDITAISYNDKLDKYLSSVLIGDELAEKIRAAFDAYVFLSYRKKDRKYAQELMRLIHKNEFCRDIAIWYDEFLTPGENFNDSIIQAIQKSGLFVLTVTPNLVNEKNYVMTEEYPLAQKEGKVIIPAEMVETNRSDLFSCFKNIPECINARNEEEFSDILNKTIKDIAIRESKKTPEHNFFIGLAYLNGIDVEVDKSKALALISSAAEKDCIEAIDKLVDMYSIGDGVYVDYDCAFKWQIKLIKCLEYGEKQITTDDFLLRQYERVSVLSELIENLEETRIYNLRLLEIYDLLASKNVDKYMHKYLQTIKRAVNVYVYHNQILFAKTIADKLLNSNFEYFFNDLNGCVYAEYNLIKSLLYKVLGKPELALSCLLTAQKSCEVEKLSDDSKKILAEIYCELAVYYSNKDNTDKKIIIYYKKAIDLYSDIKLIDVDILKSLSNCYHQIAFYYEDIKEWRFAKEYYSKSIDCLEDQNDLDLKYFSYEIVRIYCDLGHLCTMVGDTFTAKNYYLFAIKRCKNMSEINPNKYNSLFAICYFNYALCIDSFLSFSYLKKAYELAKPYILIPECKQIVDYFEFISTSN